MRLFLIPSCAWFVLISWLSLSVCQAGDPSAGASIRNLSHAIVKAKLSRKDDELLLQFETMQVFSGDAPDTFSAFMPKEWYDSAQVGQVFLLGLAKYRRRKDHRDYSTKPNRAIWLDVEDGTYKGELITYDPGSTVNGLGEMIYPFQDYMAFLVMLRQEDYPKDTAAVQAALLKGLESADWRTRCFCLFEARAVVGATLHILHDKKPMAFPPASISDDLMEKLLAIAEDQAATDEERSMAFGALVSMDTGGVVDVYTKRAARDRMAKLTESILLTSTNHRLLTAALVELESTGEKNERLRIFLKVIKRPDILFPARYSAYMKAIKIDPEPARREVEKLIKDGTLNQVDSERFQRILEETRN